MYKDYFRLTDLPFSIAPDPRFLFMSDRHREALAHLLYGVQGEGGIIVLTGEIGTGKTTLCRCLLDQLPPSVEVAFILNPRMNVEELLQTVCEELHIAVSADRPGTKVFVDAINAHLLKANAEGRRALLIIDEAQNLDPAVLEQLRLLTNLETNTRKLLQIILIGQPELQGTLARPELHQVAQRVVASYHLSHLSQTETGAYVCHRLRVAGAAPSIVPEGLMRPLFRATGGVPRLINLVCDRALLGTYVKGRQQVTEATLRQAVSEVGAARQLRDRRQLVGIAALVAAATATALALSFGGAAAGWQLPWRAPGHAPIAADQAAVAGPTAPAAPAAQAAATMATATLDWPHDVPVAQSGKLAFQAIFESHGLKFDAQGKLEPCQQAQAQGMRCFASRGGLAELLLLDQPVVLRLADPTGTGYDVAVMSLANQAATVMLGGRKMLVQLTDLAGVWSGQYTLLWKAPPGFTESIAPSQRGPMVVWLRALMAKVDGLPGQGDTYYDEQLARRVRGFQLAEGITPDGLVGPVTAIRLSIRAGEPGPSLAGGQRKG